MKRKAFFIAISIFGVVAGSYAQQTTNDYPLDPNNPYDSRNQKTAATTYQAPLPNTTNSNANNSYGNNNGYSNQAPNAYPNQYPNQYPAPPVYSRPRVVIVPPPVTVFAPPLFYGWRHRWGYYGHRNYCGRRGW